jgi:NAD dependent epimerase/dehydratase family enzyme
VLHALATRTLIGPVNAVAPAFITQRSLARLVAMACRRPALAPPAPAWALRLALGGLADEALLASARIRPTRLIASGFRWAYPDATAAISHELGVPPGLPSTADT